MKVDFRGKRVSILGAGRSGLASADKVNELGGIPFVSDSGPLDDKTREILENNRVEFEMNGHTNAVFDSDLVIVSPGVPSDAAVIQKAKSSGLHVWPEIELAYRLCRGRIIGITGSNGKTTTTALIGEIISRAGKYAAVCGNIGSPFVRVAGEIPSDGYAVVELSSFQLEMIDQFRAGAAALLNITPDHLDRHGSLEKYASAKLRVFENQSESDYAVVNYDDDYLRAKCRGLRSKTVWFSVESKDADVFRGTDGKIYSGGNLLINSADIKLKGLHNISNVCAAVAVANSINIEKSVIIDTLKSFAGVEHRLEFVRLIGGVSYINDSKGTNVDSVYWALMAVSAPVILIAGGRDKAGDFSRLNDLVAEKVKEVILLGEAAGKIEKAWNKLTECKFAKSMKEAVSTAHADASEGDTVLLSPACASFDMYKNYEERGRDFKDAVRALN